jgi:dynein heavy chain
VLRQAGKLKRAEPDIIEDKILMRALRDFNWPKIIVDDRSIFLGLINDLFPGIEADTKTDVVFQADVKENTKKAGLQAEDLFVMKCVNYAEILEVRHSCFIIGNPGCGKTAVW